MMAKFRRFALATLAASFVFVSSACNACDYAPTGPEGFALFHVDVTNGGTTAFSVQDAPGVYAVLQAGETRREANARLGKQGDVFFFNFYDRFGGGMAVSLNNKCVLNNANEALVFTRAVKLDLDAMTFHCINWGD